MSLVAELRKRALPARRGVGRAAVLGRREEIAVALDEGYSKRQVWELLREQGVLEIGYGTFSRYVGEALATNAAVGAAASGIGENGNEDRKPCR